MVAEQPTLAFSSQKAFEAWLTEEHSNSDGIWIKIAKKASGIESVTYPEAVEVALCYGWIDGQMKGLDEDYYIQRFTPRRPRSKWSKINRGKVERLISDGRMKPAGLAEIERAKADGRWAAAYDSPATAKVPPDLTSALKARPKAKALFDTLTKSQRYSILFQIQDAKRPETRQRRIEKFVDMLARGEKPN